MQLRRSFALLRLPLLALAACCSTAGHRVLVENATGANVASLAIQLFYANGGFSASATVVRPGNSCQLSVLDSAPVRHVDIAVTWDTAERPEIFRMTVAAAHVLEVRLRLLHGRQIEFADAAGAAMSGLTLQRVGG